MVTCEWTVNLMDGTHTYKIVTAHNIHPDDIYSVALLYDWSFPLLINQWIWNTAFHT